MQSNEPPCVSRGLSKRSENCQACPSAICRIDSRRYWYETRSNMPGTDLSAVLVEVWRQALVDKSDTVKLGSESYKVTQSKAKRLRQVEFVFEGKTIIGIQQNPNTKSRWAELARAGKKVMQFIVEGKYAANVADGKVTLYGKRTG